MSVDATDARRSGLAARAVPLLVLLALAAGLATMSWRRWPDVLVDYGTQLYVPWRLSEGAVLYRDIHCLYGPLSMYVNASLFALFGASFRTLFIADIAVLAAIVALLYAHLAAIGDRLAAFAACAVLLAVFGFSQYVGIGNYDYASPYSHEATHAMALAFAAMVALSRFERSRGSGWLVAAGIAVGATFLARAELAVAALGYATVRLAVIFAGSGAGPGRIAAWLGTFAAAATIPFGAALLAFLSVLPAAAAVRGAGGAWSSLLGSNIASDPFFVAAMGFDEPWENAMIMLRAAAVALAGAGVVFAACRLAVAPERSWAMRVPAAACGAAVVAGAFFVDIVELGRPFPVLVVAGLALCAWAAMRPGSGAGSRSRLGAVFAFGIFALALLSKQLLRCRIAHYGFYLAMPAAVFLCVMLVWLVPRLLASPRARSAFRGATLAVLVVLGARYVHHSSTYFVRKIFPIGAGADRIVSYARDGRAQPITDALAWIDGHMTSDATFTVLPEGIMLNFLTRRRSTLPNTTFMTIDFQAWPEAQAVADFAAEPPDYVLLVHRDTREFGVGLFGRDPRYGRQIMEWIGPRYRRVATFGAEPFNPRDVFGIAILERIDRAGAPEPSTEP